MDTNIHRSILHFIMDDIIEMKNVKNFVDFVRILYTHDDVDISFNIPNEMLLLLNKVDMKTRLELSDMIKDIGTELSPDQIDLLIR